MAYITFPPIAILNDERQRLRNYIAAYKEDIQENDKRSAKLSANIDAMEAQIKEFDLAISFLEKI